MVFGGIVSLPLSKLQSLIRKTWCNQRAWLSAAEFIQISVPNMGKSFQRQGGSV